MSLHYYKTGVLCLVISLSCCHPRLKQPPPERSFYYWKSVYSPTTNEKGYLRALNIKKLYVRFFDVTWDLEGNKAMPTAPVQFKDSSCRRFAIIPVVFISNQVLARLDTSAVGPLAAHIMGLVT